MKYFFFHNKSYFLAFLGATLALAAFLGAAAFGLKQQLMHQSDLQLQRDLLDLGLVCKV
jgi:hypothetical protein